MMPVALLVQVVQMVQGQVLVQNQGSRSRQCLGHYGCSLQ